MIEPEYLEATASFDETGTYRYNLLRRWAPGPTCLFILLNPSTADAKKLDPTAGRCLHWSMTWTTSVGATHPDSTGPGRRFAIGMVKLVNFGAMEIANAYALRSTDPSELWKHPDPVGPNNDAAIAAAVKRASLVIAGWGGNAKPERVRQIAQMLCDMGVQPYTLKLCDGGVPSHPLARGRARVPDDVKPVPWYAKGLR